MTSYEYDIGVRGRFIARLLGRIQRELAQAVSDGKFSAGVTLNDIAEKMGADRSEVERLLAGESAFSLRRLAEMLAALEKDVTFEIARPSIFVSQSQALETTTLAPSPVMAFGAANAQTSTIFGVQKAFRRPVFVGG